MWGIKMRAHLRKLFKHKPSKFWKVSGIMYYLSKRWLKGRQKSEMSGRMSEPCGLFRKLKRNRKILADMNIRPQNTLFSIHCV